MQDAYDISQVPTGRAHLCLWLQHWGASAETLIGETTFDHAPAPVAPPSRPADLDCEDFTYREDAQRQLHPGDPHGLDADGDGIACDDLPSRAAALHLSKREAAAVARDHLASRYGRTWTQGRKRRIMCSIRTGKRTVGCRATWVRAETRYRARIAVQEHDGFYRVSAKILSRRRV